MHDDWIERNVTHPSLNSPERLLRWLKKRQPTLLHLNYSLDS